MILNQNESILCYNDYFKKYVEIIDKAIKA